MKSDPGICNDASSSSGNATLSKESETGEPPAPRDRASREARIACNEIKSELHEKPRKKKRSSDSPRDSRTNTPLPSHDGKPREPRWKGLPPKIETQPSSSDAKRQATALAALRTFEAAYASDELPSRKHLLGGMSLVGRYRSGAEYAFAVKQHVELSAAWTGNKLLLTARDWLALGWVLCAQLHHRKLGLMARYEDLGELLGCCSKTAGESMAKLAALHLVRTLPWHAHDKWGNHERKSNVYWVSERVLALLEIRGRTRSPNAIADHLRATLGDHGGSGSGVEFPEVQSGKLHSTDLPELSGVRVPPERSLSPGAVTGVGSEVSAPRTAPSLICTDADAAPVLATAAERVKHRPDAPLRQDEPSRESGREGPQALKRYEHAADLELFQQRLVAKNQQIVRDVVTRQQSMLLDERRELIEAKQRLNQLVGRVAAERGRSPAAIASLQSSSRCSCVVSRRGDVIELCSSCADKMRGGRS